MSSSTREKLDPGFGDRAVALYQEHRSVQKVSQILHCGRETASRMLKARGVALHGQRDGNSAGETVACAGCGVDRMVNMSRGYKPHCIACRPNLGEPRYATGIRCGTIDGYRQHRTFGQPPCKLCRLAVKGIEEPDPFARCSDCPRLVRSGYDRCALCRRGIKPKATVEPEPAANPEPVIRWVKDRRGIWHGVVKYEPQPDREHAAIADEKPAGYDEARVLRRVLGDRSLHLHKGEAAEVVRILLSKGWAANQIRHHTGIKPERYIRQIEMERAA